MTERCGAREHYVWLAVFRLSACTWSCVAFSLPLAVLFFFPPDTKKLDSFSRDTNTIVLRDHFASAFPASHRLFLCLFLLAGSHGRECGRNRIDGKAHRRDVRLLRFFLPLSFLPRCFCIGGARFADCSSSQFLRLPRMISCLAVNGEGHAMTGENQAKTRHCQVEAVSPALNFFPATLCLLS